MQSKNRTIKVLVFLVASMTIGAFVLMALDKQSLSEGPFSLSSYTHLNSISQVAVRPISNTSKMWNRIEVYYSNTTGGNITQIANLYDVKNAKDVNMHLLVCNGVGTMDGQVQASDRWKKQLPCLPDGTGVGSGTTIRVCVVGASLGHMPTDSQVQRTVALVETLSRRCSIDPERITFPASWQF